MAWTTICSVAPEEMAEGSGMKIVKTAKYSESAMEALNALLVQLSDAAVPMKKADFIELVESDAAHLLMAEDRGRYIGTLTLVVFNIPTGVKARIEDLVVDGRERGRGVGRRLIVQALDMARDLGAGSVSLTSNSSRKAANALYQNVGFKAVNTNVYHYKIAP
jgi:ribosomal protein S18 acetylase RimI-like enzyme